MCPDSNRRERLRITRLSNSSRGGLRYLLGVGIACCLIASCRPRAIEPRRGAATSASQTAGPVFFVDRAAEVGIDFQHETDPPGSYFLPEIMGSGCALFDFDRDEDLDVLIVNLGTGYSTGGMSRAVTHRLFEQVASGRFIDVSERAGFVSQSLGMGVAIGDVNNDGWPDVYFTSYGPDQLFLNRQGGRFDDVTAAAGIDNRHWGASACFVDFDRDGWLDLFVANYVDYHDRVCTRVGGGGRDYCGPHLFSGTAAKLFRNVTGEMTLTNARAPTDVTLTSGDTPNRAARFQDVSMESGIASQRGPGLGVAAADFNADGWPDLYVANDQTANFLWINQHNGTFVEEAILRGCAYDAQGNAQASMGVALGDLDNDADLDIFLTHLDGERNTLYLNQPNGSFEDATIAAGLGSVSQPFTGFGTAFLDIDLDGDEDLVIANGHVKRPDAAKRTESPRIGAGASRSTKSPFTPDFWSPYRQRGQILLNDGDLDLVVNRIGARAAVFMNEIPRRGHWLSIKVVDPQLGGRTVYGAMVTVVAGERRWIRCLQPGTSYLSSHDSRIHVGLGTIDRIERIEVKWPEGTQTKFHVTEVDREHVLARKPD